MALYADIIELTAPADASEGDRVDIVVRVKNTYSAPIGIKVWAALEFAGNYWSGTTFTQDTANVDPGAIFTFLGYFTMPAETVVVHIYSYWYGSDGNWYYDDEMSRTVSLAGGGGSESMSGFSVTGLVNIGG